MKTHVKTIAGVTVVAPSGRLMGGDETSAFEEKLYALLGRGTGDVVVDLGEVDWINSTGLSVLIHHWHEFRERGFKLRLANLTRKTEDVLVISRLTEVFDCYETLKDALASFGNRTIPQTAG